jgi:hypothetical protein
MIKLTLFKWTVIIIWDLTLYHVAKNPIRKPKKEEVVNNG